MQGRRRPDKDVEDYARPSKDLEAPANCEVLGDGVLLAGPTVEEEDENAPDDEVQNGADTKSVGRQISALVFRETALTRSGPVEPSGIEIFHAEEYGREEHGDRSEDSRGGLERAANDDAPIAAGQMLQHQQAQGAQRKAQNKHESQEIGGEKEGGSFDEAHQTNHQADP